MIGLVNGQAINPDKHQVWSHVSPPPGSSIFLLPPLLRFSPFDDERARWLAVVVEVGAPVRAVDGAWPAACGHERVGLDAVVHGVAGADSFLVVADVEDALGSELVCVCVVFSVCILVLVAFKTPAGSKGREVCVGGVAQAS